MFALLRLTRESGENNRVFPVFVEASVTFSYNNIYPLKIGHVVRVHWLSWGEVDVIHNACKYNKRIIRVTFSVVTFIYTPDCIFFLSEPVI